jgi:L-threonylcarbamoyladenylate synthase
VVWSDAVIQQSKETHVSSSQCTYLGNEAASYGRKLYVTLYQVDQSRLTQIIVEQPPQSDAWAAVNDRLSRAAK